MEGDAYVVATGAEYVVTLSFFSPSVPQEQPRKLSRGNLFLPVRGCKWDKYGVVSGSYPPSIGIYSINLSYGRLRKSSILTLE